jgi:hypothetical protein
MNVITSFRKLISKLFRNSSATLPAPPTDPRPLRQDTTAWPGSSSSHPARYSQTRWQVRYREGTTQRSAGVHPTKAEAASVKRAIEQGDHVAYFDQLLPDHASMLLRVRHRYLVTELETRPPPLRRRHQKQAHRPDPPPLRRPPPRRQGQHPVRERGVRGKRRDQPGAHRPAVATRATAAITNPDFEDEPASPPPSRSQSRPGGRTIALDHDAIAALHAHREPVGGRARDLIFTSPAAPAAHAGPLATANFARVWQRALTTAEVNQTGPTSSGPLPRRTPHPRRLAARRAGRGGDLADFTTPNHAASSPAS